MSDRGKLFVVSGPSGVGKSSICQEAIQAIQDLRLSISYTTRAPRPGETHGREYWFVSEEEFHSMVKQQAFAEWANVYGSFYGTPWKEIQGERKLQHDIILDIDVQGAKQVMRNLSDAITVFVMPPSLEKLKKRLSGRGTDTPDTVEHRFKQAQKEMKQYHRYHYTIVNGILDEAVQAFISIVRAERNRTKHVDPAWLQQIGLVDTEDMERASMTS